MASDCGCEIVQRRLSVKPDGMIIRAGFKLTQEINYCPLHKAAPEMLGALEEIVEVRGCPCTADTIRIWQAAKAAIRAAKGKGGE